MRALRHLIAIGDLQADRASVDNSGGNDNWSTAKGFPVKEKSANWISGGNDDSRFSFVPAALADHEYRERARTRFPPESRFAPFLD